MSTIPERHIEFCRALARVAREHGMQKMNGEYRPNFQDGWDGDIQFVWEQGRHGEDSDKLFVQSNIRVHTKIGPKP